MKVDHISIASFTDRLNFFPTPLASVTISDESIEMNAVARKNMPSAERDLS